MNYHCNTYYSNATSATTDRIWYGWATSTATTATNRTWTSWVSTAANCVSHTFEIHTQVTDSEDVSYPPPPQFSAEQLEAFRVAREEEQRKYEAQQREQEKKRLAAQRAALKLLCGLIGRRAYQQYKKRGYHDVIAHSGKRYRLAPRERVREMIGNFGDTIAAWYCIHSADSYRLPPEDVMIQQLLLLVAGEKGEKLLVATANKTVAA